MKYKNYEECDIYTMINRTREISKDPYKLYVSSVLYGLMDMIDDENIKSPIGIELDSREVKDLISECKEDFLSAIDTGAKIDINGTSYTIRNASNVSVEKIDCIFDLKEVNGITTINLSGIFDVSKEKQEYDDVKKEANDSIVYFQKIIYLTETTEEGYDKLTDMEAAAYCWALFHRKNLNYPTGCFMYDKFYNQYKDCICQSMYEVIDCLKDGIKFPQRYFDFSASKIRAWNKNNNQESVVDSVNKEKAADYWYNEASIKKFFLDK